MRVSFSTFIVGDVSSIKKDLKENRRSVDELKAKRPKIPGLIVSEQSNTDVKKVQVKENDVK